MNHYTRNMNPAGLEQQEHQSGKSKIAGFAARISLLILMIFFAIAAQMHLRVEIERLNKRVSELQGKIAQLNVQCKNERNRKEMLTGWQNIQAKIRKHRLNLRDAESRQISYLELDAPRSFRRSIQTAQTEKIRPRNRTGQSYATMKY